MVSPPSRSAQSEQSVPALQLVYSLPSPPSSQSPSPEYWHVLLHAEGECEGTRDGEGGDSDGGGSDSDGGSGL